MENKCPRIAARIECYTCGYPFCEAMYDLIPGSCSYFGEYVPCEREEALRATTTEEVSC